MKNCLNIGCGNDIRKSNPEEKWINLDAVNLPGVDVKHNMDKYPWPFKDNTFDVVCAFMVLEHLKDWTLAMKEIHRISKKGAILAVKVPFFPSLYAMQDPTHKNFFTYYTFDYFENNHGLHYYFDFEYKIIERYIRFSWNPILNLISIPINIFPRIYSRYLAFIFPSNELFMKLQVVK